MIRSFFRAVLAFGATVSFAQAPDLVHDINPAFERTAVGSNPQSYRAVGGTVFFTATTETHGLELWKHAGGTTELVKDIYPGPAGARLSGLSVSGSWLLFGADDGVNGLELWRSDGTTAGTTLVKDIWPGATGSVRVTQALGSKAVVLVSGSSTRSDELWITDGTAEGTTLLVDLNTEPARTAMRSMTVRNNTLFVFTNRGIWTSDGTAAGTVKITSVTGSIVGFTSTRILFAASDATYGAELWRTDGTAAGTTLVKDVNPGTASAFDFATGISGATLPSSTLFFANDGTGTNLWKSDGTAAGTQRVKSMYPLPGAPGAQSPVLSSRGDLAWFTAAEGLWRSDGSEAGTFLISNAASARSFVEAFGAVHFFTGDQSAPELWASDGTMAGTRRVRTLPSGYLPTAPSFLNGRLHFTTGDPTNGVEPWVSEDGTAEGTHLLANIAPDPPPAGASSSPSLLRANGSNVFFTASESASHVRSLWRSDGTATAKLRDAQNVREIVTANGLSFFRTDSSLWRTDGTDAGTFAVSHDVQQILFAGRSFLYFYSGGVWRTDGTVAGTIPISEGHYPAAHFTELAGRTYYVFQSSVWVTDGSPQGTYRALPQRFDTAAPTRMTAGHGRLWFEMTNASTGSELWSSDGTVEGTVQVKDIQPGAASSSPGAFMPAGSLMFFVADDGVNGRELWRSDGTSAGTMLVRDIAPGSASSDPDRLTAVGALLFFVADGGLWRTDGTSDGTIRLIALDPMSASAGMVAASGKLWFVREDGVHGKELWRSDGTVAGTVMVADLEPGPAGSTPTELAVAGGRVFFSAQTRAAGRELFAVEPEGSDIAIADIRVAEGNSGTAIARFVVTRGGNLQSPLEVSFATANGTAAAGTDYVAQSGVLAFAAGETTKTIDVVVNGEAEIEGEETFFVILSVAATERMRATAIISADDRRAELSLVHTDALGSVRIVNAGPSMATNVRLRYSASPGYSGGSCWNEMPCTLQAGFLAPGESLLFRLEPGSVDVSNRHDPLQPPALRVATSVTAMELDSNPADNIVEASAVGGLLLPPFLVAGGNAAATYFTLNSASVTISSDGAITATPSSFSAAFDSATPVTLAAAATPGFSVLSVAVGSWEPRKGRIQIVAPGGTAKRDVRINVETYVHYAETISIPVQIAGTLHDGTRPGGTAELLDGAIVLATAGLDATGRGTFSISGVTTGDHDWHVRYSGDANFHGLTVAASIHIRPVSTTTTMTSAQTGCVFEGVVTVTASNGSRPAGEVAMRVDSIEVARLTLHPADGGKATAAYRVTLPPGQHLLQASFVPTEPFDTSAATLWATAPDCAPVLAATASAAGVSLGWTPYNGGGNVVYEVFRSSTGVSFIGLGSTQATSFVDTTATRNTVWYYFVRARGANGVIVDSNHDLATNVFFTDDPLGSGVTAVRAAHVAELRAAVNAMRTAAGLAPAFGAAIAAGQPIRAADFLAIRDALAPALAALGLPPVAPAIEPAAQAMIRAPFVQALRNAMK